GNFMNIAVNVTGLTGTSTNTTTQLLPLAPLLPSYMHPGYPTMTPFHPTGLGIIDNTVNGAWNGFNVSGITAVPVWIARNNITLAENAGTTQRGIAFTGNQASQVPYTQNIWMNNVQAAGNTTVN